MLVALSRRPYGSINSSIRLVRTSMACRRELYKESLMHCDHQSWSTSAQRGLALFA